MSECCRVEVDVRLNAVSVDLAGDTGDCGSWLGVEGLKTCLDDVEAIE